MATHRHPRSASRRYPSSLSAAREGWHRWAAKNWGWFVPLLATFGLVRGSYRGIRWTTRRVPRILRSQDRIARWLDRAAVGLLSRHPRTRRLAERWRKAARVSSQVAMTCDYCGAQLKPDTAAAHIDAHNQKAQNEAVPQGSTVVPMRRPSPRPRPPATTPISPPPAAPASGSSSTSGGSTMATNGTSTPETQQLARAALAVGEMDPQTAWELDAQLQGMARSMFQLSESLGQWIETLDAIKTDPRVTAQAGIAVGEVAEVVRTFSVTRQLFRNLYAAQFAAAEAGVRQVQRQNFFNPNAA